MGVGFGMSRLKMSEGGRRGGSSRSRKKLEALAKNREKAGRPTGLRLRVDAVGLIRGVYAQGRNTHELGLVEPTPLAGGGWIVKANGLQWGGSLPEGYPAPGDYVLPYVAKGKRPVVKGKNGGRNPDWLREDDFEHFGNEHVTVWVPLGLIQHGAAFGENARRAMGWVKDQRSLAAASCWPLEREAERVADEKGHEGLAEALRAVEEARGPFARLMVLEWRGRAHRFDAAPPFAAWEPFAKARAAQTLEGFEI